MNLFQNTAILQAVRDKYNLSTPQATSVLIAYQHGTVSVQTVRDVLGFDAKRMSSSSVISLPVQKGILKEVGKTRVKMGSRPSTIYQLVNPQELYELIDATTTRTVALFKMINDYETTAKEHLDDQDQ